MTESESRLQLASEAAGFGVHDFDPARQESFWSTGMHRILGTAGNGPIPFDAVISTIHPDDRRRVQAEMELIQTRTGPYQIECRIVRLDGAVRWVIDRGTAIGPIDPETGRAARIIGTLIDITETKRVEKELAEANAILEALFHSAPVGLGVWDRDFRFIRINKALADVNGLAPEAHIGRRPDEVLPKIDGIDNVYARWRVMMATGEPLRNVEITGETPAVPGVTRHWTEHFFPVRNGGEIVGIAALVEETTERKRAEEARHASERRASSIVEAISDGFITLDTQWRITYLSNRGEEILRPLIGDGGAALGKVFWDLFPQVTDSDFGVAYRKAVAEQRPVNVEAFYPPLDTWFDVRCYPMADGLAIYFLDVGARKRAEASLRAAHDTFRHLVDKSPFGIYVVDADFRLVQVSAGAQRVFENVRPLIGRDFADVLRTIWSEPFASQAIGIFRNTLETGEAYHAPSTIENRRDINQVESYDWKIERLVLPDGRFGVVCHFYDLSERQRHEDHIKLLMREVNHRAKNMLSLIQAVARQTAATQPRDFMERFNSRIQALAANQDLLVKNEWRSVPLDELVRSQLAHFDTDSKRIAMIGPPVAVSASAAQTLGMAVHELATNAAKYGALATSGGQIAIEWSLDPHSDRHSHFSISWNETGGPPVAPPSRLGFGSTVIDGMARMSLGATVVLDYAPTGLRWCLTCPSGRIFGSEEDEGDGDRPRREPFL